MKSIRVHLWLIACVVLAGLAGCDVEVDLSGSPPVSRPPAPAPSPSPRPPCPDGNCPYATVREVDLPMAFRQANYARGSCMWASVITAMHRQGLHSEARYWRQKYSGGRAVAGLVPVAEARGLRYAFTLEGDAEFLEWASRTRRGAAIHWQVREPGDHAVYFYGYQGDVALVIDNNDPRRVLRVPKERFLSIWKRSGGQAITPVYSPLPPPPTW